MFRTYDLDKDHARVIHDLNDEEYALISMFISHNPAQGLTNVELKFQWLPQPKKRRFRRYLKAFLVPHRGQNFDLDLTLAEPDIRVIKERKFFSFEGTVVVLDYQRPIGRRVH